MNGLEKMKTAMQSKMKSALPIIPVYPFLIAIAPVLSLYCLNSTSLGWLDLIRPLAAHLTLALMALVIAKSISESYRGAALLTLVVVVSWITYGQALRQAHEHIGEEFATEYLLIIWGAMTLAIFVAIAVFIQLLKPRLLKTTIILNAFSVVLVFSALWPLMTTANDSSIHKAYDSRSQILETNHEWVDESFSIEQKALPDFYFIILDAYARGDILETRFGFKNSKMTDWLEDAGFFVGHKSHSNYAWTHLSLSSTLNGEYLQTLIPPELSSILPEEHRNRYIAIKQFLEQQFVGENRVFRLFKNMGYHFVANDSGHSLTRKRPSSLYQAMTAPMNEFEEELVNRSIARHLLENLRNWAKVSNLQLPERSRITSMLDSIVETASYEGPKFVFFHILSPHEPFSFDQYGNPIAPHPVYDSSPWLKDKLNTPGYLDWFKANYPKNVSGLNHHLTNTIENLLTATNREAVIIIQSDHGSSLGLGKQAVELIDMKERFGILNAIFIPKQFLAGTLKDDMSAVNTFPIVLNSVFDLQIPTQSDRAYFSGGDLNFIDVTESVRN